MKSPITTHVLDTALGKPAAGVRVVLQMWQSGSGTDLKQLAEGVTDKDGRIVDLLPADSRVTPGIYRLTFDTKAYFEKKKQATFFPCVQIAFEIRYSDQHYHVPLLLSPYGYSTYRGS